MSPAPEWSGPQPIGTTEPRSPYAHFAFRDQYPATRALPGARGCYHSSRGFMIIRHAAAKGYHVETVSSVSDALAGQLGPLDRIVGRSGSDPDPGRNDRIEWLRLGQNRDARW